MHLRIFKFSILIVSLTLLTACGPLTTPLQTSSTTAAEEPINITPAESPSPAITSTSNNTQSPESSPTVIVIASSSPVSTVESTPSLCSAHKADGDPLSGLSEIQVYPGERVHIEFYRFSGDPEWEAVLTEGIYRFSQSLDGRYWRYNPACSEQYVESQVERHRSERQSQGANNAGWADQQMVDELFLRQ